MSRSWLARVLGRSAGEMSFLEHLEELRRVILASLGALVICSLVSYAFSGRLLDYIVVRTVQEAQFIRPMEPFLVRIKLALVLGAVLALPFISFQIWSFVVPGLLRHERRTVVPLAVASTALFIGGMAFSWWVMTPVMLDLLLSFGTQHLSPNLTADYLFDFVVKMAVGCGIMFQLPLVTLMLTLVRVISARQLWSKWRHAIVVILIVAAVVTPGDGPSQVILAAPVLILYFISAALATILERGRKKREALGQQEEDS